ncbi:MAG: ABC transporter substrate-binding protein [Clostridiales bacterium]|jgi:iron complex transport system substrate-binding protein|nr:ABC transporter substrate-binding protein [Clostridiales bacterium]
MKKLRIIPLLIIVLFSLALLAGCKKAPESAQNHSIVVTDMKGREIALDAPAEKIVTLTAADCEIVYALGAGDKVVGRGEYCDYPEEVFSVPAVQSGGDTNIEQIISLSPQVVIMSTMAQTDEQIEALEKAGIKVVVTEAPDIESTYGAIKLIGTVVGKDEEAANLISSMKKAFSDFSSKATDKGTKTVYYEISPLEYGLWTAGQGTFMNELGSLIGLVNIFADVEGWAEISQEQVIQRNPDYIITSVMSFGDGPTPIEEIINRPGWQDITAVKNESILNVDSYEMIRPGPRLVNAIEELYSFIYE